MWERLLERSTVIEVHLGEEHLDLFKNRVQLARIHIFRHNAQYRTQLLILLLKSQLLVHSGYPLLQPCLEGRYLVAQLFLLSF